MKPLGDKGLFWMPFIVIVPLNWRKRQAVFEHNIVKSTLRISINRVCLEKVIKGALIMGSCK